MVQFTVACVQLNAQDDLDANTQAAELLIRQAAQDGAQWVTLPENALFMKEPGKGVTPLFNEAVARLSECARSLKIWLLIGSIHPPAADHKTWNRSLLINDQGVLSGQYDKIHLFDATLTNGEAYRESDRISGGNKATLVHTPWGKLGMTICYDVRFPRLYRELAQAGADFLSIPSAFTHTTGKAHWHVLLRARAIENGCFVFAPAQCGMHPGARRTYGHSLIVDPWGTVVAEASEDKTGFITALIDTDRIGEARNMIPSLRHDRPFTLFS